MKKLIALAFAALAICSATYAVEVYGAKKSDSKKNRSRLALTKSLWSAPPP